MQMMMLNKGFCILMLIDMLEKCVQMDYNVELVGKLRRMLIHNMKPINKLKTVLIHWGCRKKIDSHNGIQVYKDFFENIDITNIEVLGTQIIHPYYMKLGSWYFHNSFLRSINDNTSANIIGLNWATKKDIHLLFTTQDAKESSIINI